MVKQRFNIQRIGALDIETHSNLAMSTTTWLIQSTPAATARSWESTGAHRHRRRPNWRC